MAAVHGNAPTSVAWRRLASGRTAWIGGGLVALVLAGTLVASIRSGAIGNAGGDPASADRSSGASAAYTKAAPEAQKLASDAAATPASAIGASGAPATTIAPTSGVGSGTSIVRSGAMSVRLARDLSVAGAVERLGTTAGRLGGFVASTTTADGSGSQGTAELALRVPSERFDEARKAVGALGRVTSVRLNGDDVSGQLVDLDARVRTLTTEEAALNQLLGQSRDVGTILQVRDRLTGVRTEIEQLTGQQARLRDQVRMASLDVSLREHAVSTSAGGTSDAHDLGDDLRTAWNALVAVVGGTIIVVAALAPLALLAAAAWLVVRRRMVVHGS
jgi:hypothetical protein